MHIAEIGHPRNERPGFFRIPRPVVPPCLLGPESTENEPESQKHESEQGKVMGDGIPDQLGPGPDSRNNVMPGGGRRCGKQHITDEIDHNMRNKPDALQGRYKSAGSLKVGGGFCVGCKCFLYHKIEKKKGKNSVCGKLLVLRVDCI